MHIRLEGKAQTLCGIGICACCWGAYKAVLSNITCIECLRAALENGYTGTTLPADEDGYLLGVMQPA